jgi:drug/metabolite transporter (DMT)-like permease
MARARRRRLDRLRDLLFFGGSRVGPSTTAILSTLEPPVTVALVFVAFGEALGAVQVLGALAVLGAAVIINLPQQRLRAA